MANLLRNLLGSGARANETVTGLTVNDWAKMFTPGHRFQFGGRSQQAFRPSGTGNGGAYAGNPIVYTCQTLRTMVFSEARCQFQRMQNGRAGDLWGDPSLSRIERPWPGARTRALMARAELDAATWGNSYWVNDPVNTGFVLRLAPKDVKVLTQAIEDPVSGYMIGEQLLGYACWVNGDKSKVTIFTPEEIFHYMPTPDPDNAFIGMSWMNPCLPDVAADELITRHKLSTLEQGGNIGYVVSMDPTMTVPEIRDFMEEYKREHEGPANAGKTVFMGGGADIKTVGQTFEELALKAVQSAGETRIAGCALVPPVLAGLSEALQGSSLNAGNYKAAKEQFVDAAIRPAWGTFFEGMESLIPAPSGSRLWYDDRDIAFLREDVLDQAAIMQQAATTIRTLIDGGYEADAAVMAVAAGDVKRLMGQHTGYVSVQLQIPGAGTVPGAPAIEGNPA
jgi:Phage portal protein